MNTVFLQLGSNQGDRIALMQEALQCIALSVGQIENQSSLYESEAWGNTNQTNFINQVIEIKTALSPEDLLISIQKIEKDLGRKRIEHWGPRTMDIDILFYDSQTINNSPELIIPHPRLSERKFVLQPMNEIAAEFIHPIFKRSITQLLYLCEDSGKVWKI